MWNWLISIDEFNRALGVVPEPLPEPLAGDPDGYVPDGLVSDTGFVPMLSKEFASEDTPESDLFPVGTGISAPNVLRALSMVPAAVRDWMKYLSIAGMANMVGQDDRAIDRMQMELVAARVSAINECFY